MVPDDPITKSAASWTLIAPADAKLGAVYDIKSSAKGVGRNGKPYEEWYRPARQSGVTYLLVLFFVAASSAMLAATAIIWSHERQRQKEEELIWIGNQFREAIGLYYQRTPGAVKRYPEKLEDLLEDRRYLTVARYLRQIYRDPDDRQVAMGLVASTQWRRHGHP